MTTVTNVFRWLLLLSGSLCLLAIGYAAWSVPHILQSGVDHASQQLTGIRESVDGLPAAILPPVMLTVDREMERAQQEIRHAVNVSAVVLNDAVVRTDAKVDSTLERVDAAIGKVDAIRADLKPVLVNAATAAKGASDLTADAKDSWDDLYWDLKAAVESGTVGMRGLAEASEAVGKSTPAMTASATAIAGASASIATNVAREVDVATKPKKWWQKALGPFFDAVRLAAVIL